MHSVMNTNIRLFPRFNQCRQCLCYSEQSLSKKPICSLWYSSLHHLLLLSASQTILHWRDLALELMQNHCLCLYSDYIKFNFKWIWFISILNRTLKVIIFRQWKFQYFLRIYQWYYYVFQCMLKEEKGLYPTEKTLWVVGNFIPQTHRQRHYPMPERGHINL